MSAEFDPEMPRQQIVSLTEQNVKLRSLLDETLDWLCPHTEAAEQFKLTGPRVWCCDCSNYLRLDEDTTLFERVQEAVKG
jgi:hypothetical protein